MYYIIILTNIAVSLQFTYQNPEDLFLHLAVEMDAPLLSPMVEKMMVSG